jgi:NADPH:quinone reductase-like Zn-dependent oxidoreductase
LSLEHFDVSLLMRTKGEGCDVILNTVSGPDIFSSFRCLARHGHFIQLAQADLTKNKSLGKTKYKKFSVIVMKLMKYLTHTLNFLI